MKQGFFTITENKSIAAGTYLMRLRGDTSAVTVPGQFVNIKLDGFYLRRPISVFDCENDELSLIYKVVGGGTGAMSGLEPGGRLDLLTGLGKGYDLSKAGARPLLIGGGAGVPPLFWLCRRLIDAGASPLVVLGFNSERDVFCTEEFRELCAKSGSRSDVSVVTVDGSYSDEFGCKKGFVTDHLPSGYTYFYTCGPGPMLRAVYDATDTGGEFSFEERMGCGFGACMGCSCKTKSGSKRVCKDGPVFKKEEILW
ncbi:MAG: dihydroorotate dehydrogenase electron transfer subunit [Clostridia bacterium]|nr:dihydroorotate dehydrogenase electron transfer subunit [Clostridia bacterium]